MELAATVMLGGTSRPTTMDDRQLAASDVLDALRS
jgi:hypothetical protein